jgi:hypothetical protein
LAVRQETGTLVIQATQIVEGNMIYRSTIEKALEHHVNAYPGTCDSCPYQGNKDGKRCTERLLIDIQTLLLAEDVSGSIAISVHGSNLHLLKDYGTLP